MSKQASRWCPYCNARVRLTKDNRYFKHRGSWWSRRHSCHLSGQPAEAEPVVEPAPVAEPAPAVEPALAWHEALELPPLLDYEYNDGGRAQYKEGRAGDCVSRAISIATGRDYQAVWDELQAMGARNPDNGVNKRVWSRYLKAHGFVWVSCGKSGRTNKDFVPTSGVLILRQRRHLCAVIDGVLHDTHTTHQKKITGYYVRQGVL